MDKQTFHIALCFDHNFAKYAAVLVQSILYTNEDNNIIIHMLADETVTAKDRQLLASVEARYKARAKLCYYDVSSAKCGFSSTRRWSVSICYRLLLPGLLPNAVDKVLYLDIDTVVLGDLSELFATDIEGKPCAACIDPLEYDICTVNRLEVSYDVWGKESYFNSGVLLINLTYWREHHVTEQAISILKNASPQEMDYRWYMPDQDILNVLFLHKKQIISSRYNLMTAFFDNGGFYRAWIRKEKFPMLEEAIRNPLIVHFTGLNIFHAWDKRYPGPYKEIWLKFAYMVERRRWNRMPKTLKEKVKYLRRRCKIITGQWEPEKYLPDAEQSSKRLYEALFSETGK